jgi:aminotransferase
MISVFGSKFTEEEAESVKQVLLSQWAGMGKKVAQFEQELAQKRHLPNMLLVDSGSNALYLAITLLNLPPNSEIILPSFTWVACAQAVLLAGHTPVFCDVDIQTQNVTAETILPHITPKTKAIMVVHYAGKPVDMNPILALGLPVIEDAAHAIHSNYHGKACGTLGEIGVFSFDSIKNLAMGEGGGITTQNEAYLARAKRLRYCGIEKSGFQQSQTQQSQNKWWEYHISEAFIKMLPTDLEAAIALIQLEKMEKYQAIRKNIWDTYQNAFENIEWIVRPQNAETHEQHSYFTYFIRTPFRDELANYLLDKKIYTTLRYHPLHLNALYKSTKVLPNSEQLNQQGLNLPLHPNLSETDVAYIIDCITKFKK